jgi:hypothetical protein
VKIALSADITSVIFRMYVVDVVLLDVESQRTISGKKRQIRYSIIGSKVKVHQFRQICQNLPRPFKPSFKHTDRLRSHLAGTNEELEQI